MTQPQQNEEVKYVDRLNIAVLSIAAVKNLIKTNIRNTFKCWEDGRNIPKQTFRIVGPAGVGKTEICYQLAEELTKELDREFECMVIKCPVLSRDDFLIPFPVMEGDHEKFKMLYSDFVPVDVKSSGIYVIDEFSRGDHNLQQLMWQIQNEYRIHQKDLPQGWFVIAIDNPDDSEYSIDNLEDAAGLRRMLHVYVEVNPQDFLNYAIANKYHAGVIEFIQAHPDMLYDFDAQKVGSVYANPASFERLSNILWGFESNGGVKNHLREIDSLSSGLINTSMTRKFLEFLRDRKDINPKDIFYSYRSKVRPQVIEYQKTNNNAKLGEVMIGFIMFLSSSRPEYDERKGKVNYSRSQIDNIISFLTDVPIDTAALFMTTVDNFPKQSTEFKYLTQMYLTLIKDKKYKTLFYDELIRCNQDAVKGE